MTCRIRCSYSLKNIMFENYTHNYHSNHHPLFNHENYQTTCALSVYLQFMTKPFNFRTIFTFILLSSLLIMAAGITREKKDHPKTIVQANHFYSATEKKADYDVKDIESNKSLILLLKKQERKSKYITDFQISLKSGEETIKCNFKKVTDLCIIPKTNSTSVNMIIECSTLPCEVSWIIYQPQIKDPNSNQIALNLFTLHDSNDHLIGQITCNDPAITTLDKDVTIYAQTPYRRVYKDNILYVLFNNEQKGYAFIDIAEKSRACSQISFTQPPKVMSVSSNSTTDFLLKQSSVSYELPEVPKSDFRIECATIRLDTIQQLKSTMIVSLFGLKGSDQTKISKHDLSISRIRTNDFTIAFKKPNGDFDKLKITFQVATNQIVILDTRLAISDTHQVELGQVIFFNLKKDQIMKFKIEADDEAEENDHIYLVPKRKNELTLSKTSCPQKTDCEFTVNATLDTQNMVYVSGRQMNSTYIDENGQGLYEFEEIQFLTIKKKAQHKIRVGDHLYFKRKLKKEQSIQVHVNSPNVLLYAACQAKCQIPDDKCRERTGNFHHPFIYNAKEDCDFLINVEGLENTQFELTIMDQQKFIALSDSTPFSYTMDSHEDRIDFQFTLKQKTDVSFNLVAPLNILKLLVSNEKQGLPDADSSQQSTDGYIFLEKSQLKGLDFVISVLKIKEGSQVFTHFTLIVSSKHSNIRLDPSVTTYETLLPSNFREFIFEFDPTDNSILSFFIYNLKDEEVNLEVKVTDEQKKWDDAVAMTIKKQLDFLDLHEVAIALCEEEEALSCQIFLRITNKMNIEVDFSVTLLMKNAIVELKDGIWQAFPANTLTATTNFYFYPRHQFKNIYISYFSLIHEVRIAYQLWKFDAQSINPAEWPFPRAISTQEQLHANFKSSNYIMIDHEQMKNKCWPSCIVLISFYIDYNQLNKDQLPYLKNENQYTSFKIMASNNQIELPEKHKMSLTVAKNQQKILLVDLKYALDKQKLTFFSSSIIGECYMNANIMTEKKSECASELSGNTDFILLWGQSQIVIDDVKKKLKQKQMEDDKNKYLCISVHSQTSCKMSIEYTTNSDGFKKINMDSTQQVVLGSDDTKYYQVDGYTEKFAKITRISGFPFISIKKCANKDEYMQCMQDFKSSTDKGKQIVVKTESFHEEACIPCIYLFKFTSIEPAKVHFHLQSTYSELELKQKTIMSDFLNEGESTKYMIQADAKEDLIVNIHIQEGTAQAQITNLNKINLSKKSDSKNKIIHFVIKAQQSDESTDNGALINPLALSQYISIYHVTIKSIDSSKAVSYTISYSSGKREIYLQDGLILDYILQPNKPALFYYFNQLANNHIFYTLSLDSATALSQLKIKTYYLEDPNDESTKKQIQVQKPAMSRKTTYPTVLFSLPTQNFFMFQLTNPSSKQERVSMGINHQQVILLPFDHEFPFQLHKNQQLNILVDVNIPGFLEVSIKKCDRSEPSFAYSFDYDGFIKEDFMYNSKLTEQPYYKQTIKANRIGTLYVNFKADIDEDSIISLKVTHTQEKSRAVKMKAGKKGILSYELQQNSAKVTIPAVDCGQNQCKGVKYYYLSSKNEQEVYSQLVCSSSFFSTTGFTSTAPLTITKINGKVEDKSITFDFETKESVYLGIKAVSDSGEEVFYQPIQIASLWEKWTKVNIFDRILMVFIVSLCLCVCIVFVRRASRKGYKPLDESQE